MPAGAARRACVEAKAGGAILPLFLRPFDRRCDATGPRATPARESARSDGLTQALPVSFPDALPAEIVAARHARSGCKPIEARVFGGGRWARPRQRWVLGIDTQTLPDANTEHARLSPSFARTQRVLHRGHAARMRLHAVSHHAGALAKCCFLQPPGFKPLLEWSILIPALLRFAPANRMPFDTPPSAHFYRTLQRLPAPVRSGCRRMRGAHPDIPSSRTPQPSRRRVGLALRMQPGVSALDDRLGRARSLPFFHQPDERKGVGK